MGSQRILVGAMSLASLIAVAGCGQGEKGAAEKAAPVDLAAVLDPKTGTGPWFICDATNAPAVVVVGRPGAAGDLTLVVRDKASEKSAVSHLTLGASKDEGGAKSWALSRDGAEIGSVRSMAATALTDGAAVTMPPISEMTIDDKTFACRWLPHTRLIGVTTRRTAFVTDETGTPTYRVYEFKDMATASKPSLEVGGGTQVADVFRFTNGDMNYAVGDGGITTMQSGRVVSGEPFAAAKSSSTAQPAQ